MFGIGGGELLVLAFVALLVFGPQRLPELARAAARGYRELTRLKRHADSALDEVKRDLKLDAELRGINDAVREEQAQLRPPAGERAATGSAAPSKQHEELVEPLAVPEEDDYLQGAGR